MNCSNQDKKSYPTVLLESFSKTDFDRSFSFEEPEIVVVAHSLNEVLPALSRIEQAVAAGRHAAGFISYEAANALNPELPQLTPPDLPLLWFGIFAQRQELSGRTVDIGSECTISEPMLDISRVHYSRSISGIRDAIADGETYQVNYTVRQKFTVEGDPYALYRRICRNQQAPFSAWINTGSHRILSASPELFFALQGEQLTMRPMKGTAARLPSLDADRQQKEKLSQSPKDQAENLMIVDLVRNDLATIAVNGTVEVPKLFEIETYPTVHQMTSTVTARIAPETGITDIFRALFPCGSITGAPKRRTMEIIRELETSPRGVYCGAIGYISPGREALFSVAIRTAVIDSSNSGQVGVGGGITWDSNPDAEFDECQAKSAFLTRDSSPFYLIETLRHDQHGYLMLDRHLHRLLGSAEYFGFHVDPDKVISSLEETARQLQGGIHKVRLLLDADGAVTVEATAIEATEIDAPPLKLAVCEQRVDSGNPFLYHKTTRRAVYENARSSHPEAYDVLLINQRGEITEGCFNNIVVRVGEEMLTPAASCGLLVGVLRQELLEIGAIREAVLTLDDIYNAEQIWLINSVRGWRECFLP
jgi:para-aminobenzoate synthetase / 4-amino-4-deoxychorismate lyase